MREGHRFKLAMPGLLAASRSRGAEEPGGERTAPQHHEGAGLVDSLISDIWPLHSDSTHFCPVTRPGPDDGDLLW